MVQHFDMQQLWEKPQQMNKVLLTELQDKSSRLTVEEEATNRKNTETLLTGTYTELVNQKSFGIATSKGCERPRKSSIDIKGEAEGTEYSHLFCIYRAALMFGFPTDKPENPSSVVGTESYGGDLIANFTHLKRGCTEDEGRLTVLQAAQDKDKRIQTGFHVRNGDIRKKKITVKAVKHQRRVSRGCVIFMEIIQTQLNKTLDNFTHLVWSWAFEQMTSSGPFQNSFFCDSIMCTHKSTLLLAHPFSTC